MDRMTSPRIYKALGRVAAALTKSGIPKAHHNPLSDYAFRSIDDIYNVLGPLLVRHRLSVFPQVVSREQRELRGAGGELLFATAVRVRFEFVSWADGSRHLVETFGEALDAADKGTGKALSAAYKYALLQTFCVPLAGEQDANASTPVALASQMPDQGWAPWAEDILCIVESCASHDALDRIQAMHRPRLRALASAEPPLYARIGEALRARRASFPTQGRGA